MVVRVQYSGTYLFVQILSSLSSSPRDPDIPDMADPALPFDAAVFTANLPGVRIFNLCIIIYRWYCIVLYYEQVAQQLVMALQLHDRVTAAEQKLA